MLVIPSSVIFSIYSSSSSSSSTSCAAFSIIISKSLLIDPPANPHNYPVEFIVFILLLSSN